jgi:hypothetical protein
MTTPETCYRCALGAAADPPLATTTVREIGTGIERPVCERCAVQYGHIIAAVERLRAGDPAMTEESLRARADAVIRRAQTLIANVVPAVQRWREEGVHIPPALQAETLSVCDELDALIEYGDDEQAEQLTRIATGIASLRASVEAYARAEGGPDKDDPIH